MELPDTEYLFFLTPPQTEHLWSQCSAFIYVKEENLSEGTIKWAPIARIPPPLSSVNVLSGLDYGIQYNLSIHSCSVMFQPDSVIFNATGYHSVLPLGEFKAIPIVENVTQSVQSVSIGILPVNYPKVQINDRMPIVAILFDYQRSLISLLAFTLLISYVFQYIKTNNIEVKGLLSQMRSIFRKKAPKPIPTKLIDLEHALEGPSMKPPTIVPSKPSPIVPESTKPLTSPGKLSPAAVNSVASIASRFGPSKFVSKPVAPVPAVAEVAPAAPAVEAPSTPPFVPTSVQSTSTKVVTTAASNLSLSGEASKEEEEYVPKPIFSTPGLLVPHGSSSPVVSAVSAHSQSFEVTHEANKLWKHKINVPLSRSGKAKQGSGRIEVKTPGAKPSEGEGSLECGVDNEEMEIEHMVHAHRLDTLNWSLLHGSSSSSKSTKVLSGGADRSRMRRSLNIKLLGAQARADAWMPSNSGPLVKPKQKGSTQSTDSHSSDSEAELVLESEEKTKVESATFSHELNQTKEQQENTYISGTSASTVSSEDAESLKKYVSMLKMGIPPGAVQAKLRMDSSPITIEEVLSAFQAPPAASAGGLSAPVAPQASSTSFQLPTPRNSQVPVTTPSLSTPQKLAFNTPPSIAAGTVGTDGSNDNSTATSASALDSLFARVSPKSPLPVNSGKSLASPTTAAAGTPKQKKITLVDARRAMNCGIALARVRLPQPRVALALRTLCLAASVYQPSSPPAGIRAPPRTSSGAAGAGASAGRMLSYSQIQLLEKALAPQSIELDAVLQHRLRAPDPQSLVFAEYEAFLSTTAACGVFSALIYPQPFGSFKDTPDFGADVDTSGGAEAFVQRARALGALAAACSGSTASLLRQLAICCARVEIAARDARTCAAMADTIDQLTAKASGSSVNASMPRRLQQRLERLQALGSLAIHGGGLPVPHNSALHYLVLWVHTGGVADAAHWLSEASAGLQAYSSCLQDGREEWERLFAGGADAEKQQFAVEDIIAEFENMRAATRLFKRLANVAGGPSSAAASGSAQTEEWSKLLSQKGMQPGLCLYSFGDKQYSTTTEVILDEGSLERARKEEHKCMEITADCLEAAAQLVAVGCLKFAKEFNVDDKSFDLPKAIVGIARFKRDFNKAFHDLKKAGSI